MVNTMKGNIILDCQIKTHDGWVDGVKFLHKTDDKRAQSSTAHGKTINHLCVEFRHLSESITQPTAKAFGIQITSTFKPCEDCTLGKAKQQAVIKKVIP